MENVSNNKVLCLNDETNIKRKKAAILNLLEKGVDVLAVFDTETTGLNVYPKVEAGMWRDRILEVGFIMYYRDGDGEIKPIMLDGEAVSFQEYVNPFRESKEQKKRAESVHSTNPEALEVHKITNNFLFGKEEFNGLKLHKPAPTFAEMKPFMEDFLCLNEMADLEGTMHFVAHNGKKFDAPMLTEEMYLVDQYNPEIKVKRTFESMIPSLIDTHIIMQDLYDKQDLKDRFVPEKATPDLKPNYSMSFLAHMLNVEETGREDFHGALLDSLILKNVFNELLKTPEWNNAANKIEIKKLGQAKGAKKIVPLPSLSNEQEVLSTESPSALTIIKTDASFNEGTGTIKEYVAAAKDAGIESLTLGDAVSLARFVEFYEECKAADIKPIIGTTFRVESSHDIFNHIHKNKASGASDSILKIMNEVLGEAIEKTFNSLEELVSEYSIDIDKFEKVAKSISEVNKKAYSSRETKAPAMLKLVEKVARDIVQSTGNKYKKDAFDFKKLESALLADTNMIKYSEFSRVDGYSDLLLVADNNEGFDTLKKLISQANEHGQHFLKADKGLGKGELPLITLEQLDKTKDSVTALIGHKNDILGKAVKANDVKRAQIIVRDLKNIYGDKLKGQLTTSEQTISKQNEDQYLKNITSVCNKQGVEMIAAHHSSFAKRSDFKTHVDKYAILLEKTSSSVILDSGKTKEEHIQSAETLKSKFINNAASLNAAERMIKGNDLSPVLHQPSLPKFKTKDGKTQSEELYERALSGLRKKLPSAFKKQVAKGKVEGNRENYLKFCNDYKERLDYEMGIINDMDFPGYFLIKQQMIDFCKQEGIPVGAGRGSAAGSLVVYSLGITDADPIEHGLIFERFLNPERKEMPDIDTDIDGEHREKVLKFLCEEYADDGLGYSGAAYIMTKGTFSAKNTLRAIAKSEGMSLRWADDLAKLVSEEPGTKLLEEIEDNEILSERYHTEAKTRKLIDRAIELEKNGGRQISIGKHAGGVVVGNLVSQAPITYVKGIPVVQADKNDIEAQGAVKFDLLGLNTLSKLDLALKNIENNKGIDVLNKIGIEKEGALFNFDNFQYDDRATYEMLHDANSTNVFQIESQLFKDLLKKMKPDSLEEIVALVSLGRPGPMQSGMDQMFIENKFEPTKREKYHPLIDNLLDETHGTIIYQEQVMAIAQKLSGFTMGGADKLRKAMGKKKIEEMHKQKSLFVDGAKKNGVDEELSTEIFDTIEKFAGYGFNKSHALAYSLLTYKMAYLRKHYPTETMASILSMDAQGNSASKHLPKDIQSCKEVGLTLYTPNINKSEINFTAGKTSGILYGLSGIKGASFNSVIKERNENGDFKNIEDYMLRCGSSKSIELLIDTGAMDSLSLLSKLDKQDLEFIKTLEKEEAKIAKRTLLKAEYIALEPSLSSIAKRNKYDAGSFNEHVIEKDYADVMKSFKKNKSSIMSDILSREDELLGGYITAHPLDIGNVREDLKQNASNPEIKLSALELDTVKNVNNVYTVSGCVKSFVFDRTSKAGNKFAIIEVSDESSTTSLFMSNDAFHKLNTELKAKNGKGLEEGSILGVDVSFYEKEGVKTSIDAVYVPEHKLKVDMTNGKKKQKPKNRY